MPEFRITVEMEVEATSEGEAQAIVALCLEAALEIGNITFSAVQNLDGREFNGEG